VVGAGDVAGAAGAGADAGGGFHHRADHLRVLAHAQVIVRAPDHHVALAVRRMPDSVRKASGDPLEVGEHAVTPLVMQTRQRFGEVAVVIHHSETPSSTPIAVLNRNCPATL
jgi:hypothetical protein